MHSNRNQRHKEGQQEQKKKMGSSLSHTQSVNDDNSHFVD